MSKLSQFILFLSLFFVKQFAFASLPLADLKRFTTVLENIKQHYVNDVSDPKLFEDAIKGMLEGLDPHSSYLNAEDFADLKASTSGKFGGLGIEVTMESGLIKVISPIDDTPASAAGIEAGDLIIQINETPVKGLSLKEAVDLMRGEPGSNIKLMILRASQSKPLNIELERAVIKVVSVKARMLEDKFGYARVSQFQNNSGTELLNSIKKLQKESGGLKGLVLDLRNNPGGILEASVDIANIFLDKSKLGNNNTIVYTEGRMQGSKMKEKARNGDMLNGAPLVVLINGGSASASEIVAGALQDHKRALILGTKSFGKGSVQTVLPLIDDRGLKLTTALYFTPNGRSIQAQGITPDIVIKPLKISVDENTSAFESLLLREQDLQGHLQNNQSKNASSESQESEKPLWNTDFQLFEALNLLKALSHIHA